MVRASTNTDEILAQVQLLDAPGGTTMRVCFVGPFEGREVTWTATIHALRSTEDKQLQPRSGHNFIEVSEDMPDGVPVVIGLDVERIDPSTVRNAIIMMRQYRRLRRGRHEW